MCYTINDCWQIVYTLVQQQTRCSLIFVISEISFTSTLSHFIYFINKNHYFRNHKLIISVYEFHISRIQYVLIWAYLLSFSMILRFTHEIILLYKAIFLCMNISQFDYSLSCKWIFGLLSFLHSMNKTAIQILLCKFFLHIHNLGKIPGNRKNRVIC